MSKSQALALTPTLTLNPKSPVGRCHDTHCALLPQPSPSREDRPQEVIRNCSLEPDTRVPGGGGMESPTNTQQQLHSSQSHSTACHYHPSSLLSYAPGAANARSDAQHGGITPGCRRDEQSDERRPTRQLLLVAAANLALAA